MALSVSRVTVTTTPALLATASGKTKIKLAAKTTWSVSLGSSSSVTTSNGFDPGADPGWIKLNDGEELWGVVDSGVSPALFHVLAVN